MFPISIQLYAICIALSLQILSVQTDSQRQAKLHFNKATELSARDDAGAEREFWLAIQARNNYYPEAYYHLSLHLRRNLRFEEAFNAMATYIKQLPPEKHDDNIHELEGLKQAAISHTRANMETPALPELISFINIILKYGRKADAVPYAYKAIQMYPNSAAGYIAFARLLTKYEERERLLDKLNIAINLDPDNPEPYTLLGWFYYLAASDSQNAELMFRKALRLSQERDTDAWLGLGRAFSMQKRNREAITAFRKFLSLQSGSIAVQQQIQKEIKELEKELKH